MVHLHSCLPLSAEAWYGTTLAVLVHLYTSLTYKVLCGVWLCIAGPVYFSQVVQFVDLPCHTRSRDGHVQGATPQGHTV